MSVQILGKGKKVALKRRHARLRKHISGTPELPRLVVTPFQPSHGCPDHR